MSSQRSRSGFSQRMENSQNNTKRSRVENSQCGTQEFSQGSSQRKDDMTEEQMQAAVQNVTAFLLCELRSKRKIRKEDVVVNALNKSSRQYAEILKRVQAILSSTFGLHIAKVPDLNETFIIVNRHRARFVDLTIELSNDGDVQDDVILTVVLGSIFMNRGQMFESHLLTILETIGFLSDKFYGTHCEHKMKDHVTSLVKKTFVKQMYLDADVVPRPQQQQNPPLPEADKVTLYRWGYRALVEVNLDRLVEYLVKMHDGKHPPGFPRSYYNELKKQQQKVLQNCPF